MSVAPMGVKGLNALILVPFVMLQVLSLFWLNIYIKDGISYQA